MQGIAAATQYPADCAIAPDAPATAEAAVLEADEESAVDDTRAELVTTLKNAAKLIPEAALASAHEALQRAMRTSDAANGGARDAQPVSWQEVEAAVMLLYELGEAMPDEVAKVACGKFEASVLAAMAANMPHQRHRLVAGALLECYVRYFC